MRFRTRLFAMWSGLVVLLGVASFWPVQQTIRSSFAHVAAEGFAQTRRGLHSLQAEHMNRMRQAGGLIMNIPELRALIAEQSFEVSRENMASLRERLDNLAGVMDVDFLCVLDSRGTLIAQNHKSPWTTLEKLGAYLTTSPQARALVRGVFAGHGGMVENQFGLWVYEGRVFQVVGAPLIFGEAQPGQRPDIGGALLMAIPITDALASELARSHGSEVTFLAAGKAVASSLSGREREEVERQYQDGRWPGNEPFEMRLGRVDYHSSVDALVDPSSGRAVGAMLIQSSLADAQGTQATVFRGMTLIMITGLALVALGSFVLSGAITRPVRELLSGVRRVGHGDLELSLEARSGDELGELAKAFNDMVGQLRSRRELQRLVDESQAASKAKSQFLANMSHEIRTPLNGVIGMSDLLLGTELDAKQRKYAALVKSSAQVLTSLINDILDFSKIEAGKLEIESIEFELGTAVREVVELLSPKAGGKGLELVMDLPADLGEVVKGDPVRVRQVLMNLVNNAIKFTEKGEVRVKVRRAEKIVRFEVIDTGIGIPAGRMDRLFRSFSQVDASTTRKYGGTGLGLAICKQLTELMGGNIGVRSEQGKGTTFWFTLLMEVREKKVGQVTASQASQMAAPVSRDARVLLAEDNEVNQIFVMELLAGAGFACDVAANGKEALEMVEKGGYGIVLMDCQMPRMDGFEATAAIRQWETSSGAARRIPIVALTANAISGDRERCLAAGMDAYCTKPVEARQLIETMEELLGQKTEAREVDHQEVVDMEAPRPPVPLDLDALLSRCTGKADLAAIILEKFEKQAQEAAAQMEQTISAGDGNGLARVSHSLKGAAGMVGAQPLRELAMELERIGNSGDVALADEQLGKLVKEVERCTSYIQDARVRLTGKAVAAGT